MAPSPPWSAAPVLGSGAFPGSFGGFRAWGGEVGCIRAGLCPTEGAAGGPCLSGRLPSAEAPLSRAVVCGLGVEKFVGEAASQCGGARPEAASVAVALRPCGQIRWLESSSGPERLFRHMGGLAVTPSLSGFFIRKTGMPVDQGPGEGTLGWPPPIITAPCPPLGACSARPHTEPGIHPTV